MFDRSQIIKLTDYLWEIPRSFRNDMRVPARIYASEKLLEETEDEALTQLVNTTTMPGIVKYGLAMPDIHSGYGPPIGGVGAMELPNGVISPGFVGYDENCGVRLLKSDCEKEEISPHLENLALEIQKEIPSGLGKGRKIKLSIEEIDKILEDGARYLVEKGYGEKDDIENCEAGGQIEEADASFVSDLAKRRGEDQVGTLGSGNHFTEIQKVVEIYDEEIAKAFGLFENQVVIMIHTGSRGLGHQNCTDYLKIVMRVQSQYEIELPDKELACVPFNSPEGQRFFKAMNASCNFAWANRQMITYYLRSAWQKVISRKINLKLLYDVAHNIAKVEEHQTNGQKIKLIVHRKGATRAFPPGHLEIPEKYRSVGQPVIIPGTMGTASYVLVGTEKSKEAFHTVCFSGDTKVITNKGIFTLKEIYKNFSKEKFLTPSLNLRTLSIEWKPILRAIKRQGKPIEISISQTGRSKTSRLKVTPDHEFITIKEGVLKRQKMADILSQNRMVCVLDYLPSEIYEKRSFPKLAYLIGALSTDGYISLEPIPRVMLIQKKTSSKIEFIKYVQNCFYEIFKFSLEEKRTHRSQGIIRGREIKGEATEFICHRKQPAEELLKIKNNLLTWVLGLNREATLNFLAGVLDGDGTWNPFHKTLSIFCGKDYVADGIIIACLKLGILPYISEQRGNCKIIQISEKVEELAEFTKRVKIESHSRKYGTKMFAIRQLFEGVENLKWPFLPKLTRNNLMEANVIFNHYSRELSKYPLGVQKRIQFFKNAPFRMQRVRKLQNLKKQEVFNLTVKNNHNYFVLTESLMPVLVGNCHGAGRAMSRHKAAKNISPSELIKELEGKGIVVRCQSLRGLTEESPQAYKDINEVITVVEKAGLAKKVAKLIPLAVIKGE